MISLRVAVVSAAFAVLVWPSSSAPAVLSAGRRSSPTCSSTSCGGGSGWRRIAFLNMSDPAQHCPSEWREIASPKRTCGRRTGGVEEGCDSVLFSTNGTSYSHVCGRIAGYQYSQTMAFAEYNLRPHDLTIDGAYVDGVSITHGSPREHIWTLASAWSELDPGDNSACPCANSAISVPPWVGKNFFCETAATGPHDFPPNKFFGNNTLWDGRNCGSGNSCCEFNSPPYFCRSLPQPTTDDIEVRLCGVDGYERVDTPIELIEMYIM